MLIALYILFVSPMSKLRYREVQNKKIPGCHLASKWLRLDYLTQCYVAPQLALLLYTLFLLGGNS